MQYSQDKCVRVTTAWHVLGLWIDVQPTIWKVAANILNKQSRTADKVWDFILVIGWGAENYSPLKHIMLQNIIWCLIPELSHCNGLRIGTGGGHL